MQGPCGTSQGTPAAWHLHKEGLFAFRKRRHAQGLTGVRRGALVEGGGGSGRRCALIRFRRPRISWGPVVRWVAGARLASLHGDPARISTALPPHGCAARRCTGLGSSGGLCMQTSPGAPQRATQRCTAAWLLPVARCHSCDAAASSSRMQAQPRGPYCTRRAPQPGAAPGRGRRWPHTPQAAQRRGPPRGRSARRPPPPPARPPRAGRSPAGWAAAPAPCSWAPRRRRPRCGASARAAARRRGALPPGRPARHRGPPGQTRPRRLRGRRPPSRRRRPRPCRRRRCRPRARPAPQPARQRLAQAAAQAHGCRSAKRRHSPQRQPRPARQYQAHGCSPDPQVDLQPARPSPLRRPSRPLQRAHAASPRPPAPAQRLVRGPLRPTLEAAGSGKRASCQARGRSPLRRTP